MGNPPSPDPKRLRWRDELVQALDSERIPPKWRARLLAELDDHLADLKEETAEPKEHGMSMDADSRTFPETRLGLPQDLVSAAAAEYRKLGFFGRRPLLTFGLGPLVLTPILFVALALLVIPLLLSLRTDPANTLFDVPAIRLSFHYIPFAVLAWMFCRLARRQGRGWRCIVPACITISVYAALLVAAAYPAIPGGQNSVLVGIYFPPYHLSNHLQALVPLAIGALFVWRSTIRPPAEASAARPFESSALT